MKKKLFGFIITEFLGVFFLIAAIAIIWKDTDLDITKVHTVVGQVVSKDIVRTKNTKYPKRLFFFKLNNSDQEFTIYRSYEGYTDLEYRVNLGDTLKVYFRPTSSGYNRNVYQIEKNDTILEKYDSYNKYSSTNVVLILFTGLLLIIIGFITYFKINLGTFLMRLVDSDHKKNIG